MRVWRAIALASLMLTAVVETTSTARCFKPRSVSEEVEKSDAVFAGKVIAEEYRSMKTASDQEDLQQLGEGKAPEK